MPSSYWQNIPATLGAILAIKPRPRRILDVGVGMGKYGSLIREYMPGRRRLDGVEVWPAYLSWQWQVYDRIYIGDVRELELPAYDLVLLIDIVEHFDEPDAVALVERFGEAGHIVLSTPHRLFQHRWKGENAHERHRSLWTGEMLADLVERNGWTHRVIHNPLSLIAVIET